eukprot:TRINITY_DN2364_c0_g1_i1.p1 TRINITY_DN2364_c0_g1~~TRINITY_DN2364_c0_g1_i1.p1  ORF type:complete len:330 (-),score=102.86 TRINITY_DN2364_c0_g1_i1:109-1098(-)
MLFRYLRGYRYDVAQAIEALERSLQWREENKIDDIKGKAEGLSQMEFPNAENAMKYGPHMLDAGFQKNGNPFSIDRSGLLDPQGFVDNVKLDDLMLYQYYNLEKKIAQISKLTKENNRFFCTSKVFDLNGLGFKHLHRQALGNMQTMLAVGQANYPEMIDKIFVVNAPSMFSTLWALIKPMLNPRTCAKVVVLGSGSYDQLYEYIDPSELPVWLGGYNLNDMSAAYDPKEGCADIYVRARSTETKRVPVKAGEKAVWDIRISNFDVIVEVTFEYADSNKKDVLVEKKKYKDAINGELQSTEAGTLVVSFDNSYSFMTGKTVPCRIGILH